MKAFLKISSLFLISIIFLSCEREEIEMRGPELGIASKNFEILSPFYSTKSSVNFEFETTDFNAVFNEKVTWTITISGTQTQASKKITGTSSQIDITNSIWDGAHDGKYFFMEGEDVIAKLTIFGLKTSWYDTINIIKNKIYPGTLIYDFDNHGLVIPSWQWWDFFDGTEKIKSIRENERDPIQGNYYAIHGMDGVGPNAFYVGGFSHSPVGLFGLTGSPAENYFNCFLRSVQGPAEAVINIYENDGDKYEFRVITNWEGWRLYSVKLSDANFFGLGDGIKDISKINKVEFILVTSGGSGIFAGYDIDYIVFTKGGSFTP